MSSPTTFWQRTAPEGACVVWTGGKDDGYGRLSWNGKIERAHRIAFYLRMGRWPNGILRHLCNNRACILHAVEGTVAENNQDTVDAGNHYFANRTRCPLGHSYDDENTYRNPQGRRACRKCTRRQKLEWHHRNKGKS